MDAKELNEKVINDQLRYHNILSRLNSVRADAIRLINEPAGKKIIHLTTGEKAIDMDDAWLIIGHEDGVLTEVGSPFLRDKRDQRLKDKDADYVLPIPQRNDIIISWDTDRLMDLLQKIIEQ